MDLVKSQLVNGDANLSVTENGAVGFKTTGRKLLDMNFAVSSMRNMNDAAIADMFADACAEDMNTAIVWLFFARDVRGGLGERRLFRVCMKYLAREFSDKVRKIMPLIAEYGRWDDLIDLCDTKVRANAYAIIRSQLTRDMSGMKEGKSVSLLAKWMPSENASSYETKRKAEDMRKAMGLTPRVYRIVLSKLRKYIDVIERKMSSGEWESISYEAVPSRANLIYNSAFLRHDEERRREYLSKLEKGKAKINASTLFPHDIVHKYGSTRYRRDAKVDPAVEALWKSLPNTVEDDGGTIVVADGSGSMSSCIGNSNVTALEVANALAIYFAERLSGPYKNQYITFSEHPQLVDLSGASTLFGKLGIAYRHNEVSNTNIEAVFDLILDTAVTNRLEQKDLPKNILIISDMEFDSCATCGSCRNRWSVNQPKKTLFDQIARKYAQYGYRLPRLVFWNVCSRTGTIPVKESDLGVALVSGFSPNVAKMVMSGKLDPIDALMDTLNSARYDAVRQALAS